MKVTLRNPDRVVDVAGPATVGAVLKELDVVPEAVLVIRDATLLTRDERVSDHDELEIRPVLSGGAAAPAGDGRRPESRLSEAAEPPMRAERSEAEAVGMRVRHQPSGSGTS